MYANPLNLEFASSLNNFEKIMEKIDNLVIRQTSQGSSECAIKFNTLFDKRKPNHEEVVLKILQLIADTWIKERLELNRFDNAVDSELSTGGLKAKLEMAKDGATVFGAIKEVAGVGRVFLIKIVYCIGCFLKRFSINRKKKC